LPPLYVTIYIGIIFFMVLFTVAFILQGRIAIPGLISIIGIIGLIQNRKIKRHVAVAQETFLASRKRMEQTEIE
jgi:hypothetical protein